MTHDTPPAAPAEAYLAELERCAAVLPANRRVELLADVRSHIEVALAEMETGGSDTGAGADESVRAILNQLGSPQDIVAAAASDLPNAPTDSPTLPAGSAAREAFALILLLIGGALFWLVPVVSWIGWFIGLVLLCLSRRWTVRDKLIGAAGVALAPVTLTGSVLLAAGTESCTDGGAVAAPTHSGLKCTTSGVMPPAVAIALVIALLAVIAFATIRLTIRLRRT